MNRGKYEKLVLNMVNFHILFETEFIRLIPIISNSDITPLLSKILNEIHLQGKTTVTNLSNNLDLSLPNTSRSVKKLYNLGYVDKTQDENDKRIVYFTLTMKGFELIKEFLMIYQEKFLERFDVFSEQEIDELNNSFANIKALFIKMRTLNNN